MRIALGLAFALCLALDAAAQTYPAKPVRLIVPYPQPVVQRLNAEFVKALQQPDLRQRLASQGAEPLTSTPEEFAAYLRAEIDKWAKVVKAAGMKAD